MERTSKPTVTCNDCGFEWYGRTSAHALRLLGNCMKCHGELVFDEQPAADEALEPVADVPAHLVLGNPRY